MRSSANCGGRAAWAAVAFVFLCAGAGLGLAAGGKIRVAPEVMVAGDTLRLADIASLEGEAAARFSGVGLGPAPAAGETRTLQGAAILAALERVEGGLGGVVYTIPVRVRVRRAAQEVGEDAVRDVVERFLRETLGPGAGDGVLRSISIAGPVLLPAGPYRARVIAPPGAPLLGRVRLQVEFSVEDRPVRTVWVTADIGLYAPVVVVRRPIARGETIAPADLSVERRDLSQLPRGIVSDLAEAAGRIARAP